MKKSVVVLSAAAADIQRGIEFYNAIHAGAGDYFKGCMISQLNRLGSHFGKPSQHFGFFRVLVPKFPYAIFYRDLQEVRQVVAVLDLRQDAKWLGKQLKGR